MLIGTRIAFIGGGYMAESLRGGLLRTGAATPHCFIVNGPQPIRRDVLRERFGAAVCTDNHEAASGADLLVLCIEPQVLNEVLNELAPFVQEHPLGDFRRRPYPMSRIQHYLKSATRVVCAMPNTHGIRLHQSVRG